jgi:hypothetical protein
MRVDQQDFRYGSVNRVYMRLVTHAEKMFYYTGVAPAGLERVGLCDDEALLPHNLGYVMGLYDLIFLAEFVKFERVSNRLRHNYKGLFVHGKSLSKYAPVRGRVG